nr:uncharacterized protein LOC111503721 isoform X2 [Leptinotarsa decemlineata]
MDKDECELKLEKTESYWQQTIARIKTEITEEESRDPDENEISKEYISNAAHSDSYTWVTKNLPQDNFDADFRPKRENSECCVEQDATALDLIKIEIPIKDENMLDAPEYFSTETDLPECDIRQVEVKNEIEASDEEGSFNSQLLLQNNDGDELKRDSDKGRLQDNTEERPYQCEASLRGKNVSVHLLPKIFHAKQYSDEAFEDSYKGKSIRM